MQSYQLRDRFASRMAMQRAKCKTQNAKRKTQIVQQQLRARVTSVIAVTVITPQHV